MSSVTGSRTLTGFGTGVTPASLLWGHWWKTNAMQVQISNSSNDHNPFTGFVFIPSLSRYGEYTLMSDFSPSYTLVCFVTCTCVHWRGQGSGLFPAQSWEGGSVFWSGCLCVVLHWSVPPYRTNTSTSATPPTVTQRTFQVPSLRLQNTHTLHLPPWTWAMALTLRHRHGHKS